jgi:general secretion pathway protein L
MTPLQTARLMFWRWLDQVAQAILALVGRFLTKRSVRFVEGVHGRFAVFPEKSGTTTYSDGDGLQIENGAILGHRSPQIDATLRGGRVELILRPDRFVFKPLELPSRAAEFLSGVVRAQIDRLTPWDADHAAFGFSTPIEMGTDRIVVIVAATARVMLMPILNAFTSLGVRSVTIRTSAPQSPPDAPAITVMEENIARTLDLHVTRRILLVLVAFAFLVPATAEIAAKIIDQRLQARQDDLARRIEHTRRAALLARDPPNNLRTLAERALVQRKNQSPSAVIALEILSQIVPDDTYVNELRIEGDKVRLSGITHDAPRLVRLIERTRHFTQATFFAPITRSPSEDGDHFSIEARMEPNFAVKP